MNPYGDPQSARARARVPGSPDAAPQGPPPRPDAYRRQQPGGGPVGQDAGGAVAGRASVGSARPAAGSARVGGRAVVGQPPADAPGAYGGARASVARAAVRPVSSGGPGYGGFGQGGGSDDGNRPGGNARAEAAAKNARRRRRANILTSAAAVLVILLGAGVVGGTYFFDDVDLPPPKTESQANTFLYANNETFKKVGDQNRTVVPEKNISELVERAVAAAEDKNFYRHGGIDMKGIARAAWNNFTGGSQQGASTITQQYARYAADLKAISYNRKIREAVIARKLESSYDKEQIMGFYLNAIYFGRGAYGIEAAAKAYFNKSVTTPPGQKNALTPAEAAVLASVIKQPEPIKGGHPGYDPASSPVESEKRMNYTLNNMLEEGWINPEQRQAAVFPKKTVRPLPSETGGNAAEAKPSDMILKRIRAELREMGIDDNEQTRGGLQVKTTISPAVQKAAEDAARRSSKSSPMNGRPATYQAAIVAIDPRNGRVLGYYGGDDPNGTDYAGLGTQDGVPSGGMSPGSTFKIYTLAAGLEDNMSFETTWNGEKEKVGGGKISNAGRDPAGLVCPITRCDLKNSTIQSYNFPFYWIADYLGSDKILDAAKKAGLRYVFPDKGAVVDLTKSSGNAVKSKFGNEVGIGQYRVVPLEHANGVATLANGGIYRKAHFVLSVKRADPDTGKLITRATRSEEGKRVFDVDKIANLDSVLQKIPEHANHSLDGNRPAIAKTGTWEFDDGKDDDVGNGDAWTVGAVPQLAATVWVGAKKNKIELKDNDGSNMFGSDTPGAIWEKFMNAAIDALALDREEFPEGKDTGDKDHPAANGEAPPPPPPAQNDDQNQDNPVCRAIPALCDNNGNNNNGNNGGNNNGNNGNNNGNNNDQQRQEQEQRRQQQEEQRRQQQQQEEERRQQQEEQRRQQQEEQRRQQQQRGDGN